MSEAIPPTSNPMSHAEELRMLVKMESRSKDYTDKAMLSAAAEIERLTRERDSAREALRISEQRVREHWPERDRLRAALQFVRDNAEAIPEAAAQRARDVLSNEPNSAHETFGGWQPIETAPKDGRTLLLGYYNSHGKWRLLHGQWFEQDSMDEWNGDDYGNPAGWYEISVENDDPPNCWATKPTHWQPTPRPPEKAGKKP